MWSPQIHRERERGEHPCRDTRHEKEAVKRKKRAKEKMLERELEREERERERVGGRRTGAQRGRGQLMERAFLRRIKTERGHSGWILHEKEAREGTFASSLSLCSLYRIVFAARERIHNAVARAREHSDHSWHVGGISVPRMPLRTLAATALSLSGCKKSIVASVSGRVLPGIARDSAAIG